MRVADQLAIEPGCAVSSDLTLQRQTREDLDANRRRSRLHPLEAGRLLEVIGADDPRPVRLAFDSKSGASHRFEPAHMGFGKSLARARIVTEMDIDAVPAFVRCSDFGHGAIDGARAGWPWLDRDDRAGRHRLRLGALADLDIMRPAVDPIDDQVVPIVELVGQASRQHSPDEPTGPRFSGIIDHVIRRRTRQAFARQFPMDGFDDVAALAHAPEHGLQILRELPLTRTHLLGQAKTAQLLQPASTQRLLERIASNAP